MATTPAAAPTTPPAATPPATAPATTRPPATRKPAATPSLSTPSTPRPPASYDPERDLTDLVATTKGLVLERPVDGVRHGNLIVTIINNGPHPVWDMTFIVELPESMSAAGGDWAGCTRLRSTKAGFPAGSKCVKGYLAPGKSRTFRLGVSSPAAKDGDDSLVSRWLVDVWNGEVYSDLDPTDNRRIFSVTRR
ncbi:hypothetical protein ACFQ1L_18915 [Phytohabitans flavus]